MYQRHVPDVPSVRTRDMCQMFQGAYQQPVPRACTAFYRFMYQIYGDMYQIYCDIVPVNLVHVTVNLVHPLAHVPGTHPRYIWYWSLVPCGASVYCGWSRCACRAPCRWLRFGEGSRATWSHSGCGWGFCTNRHFLEQAERLCSKTNDLCKAKQAHIT